MKRKLSLLLSLLMVLTLIPMSAFAAPGDITIAGRTDLVLGGTTAESNPPEIFLDNSPRIGADLATRPLTTATTFTVVLDGNNADFVSQYPSSTPTVPGTIPYPVTATGVTVVRTGSQTLEVTVDPDVSGASIRIPMHLVGRAAGNVNVRFERLSGFNNVASTFTVATVQNQQSNIVVDRIGNIARNNTIIETRTSQSRLRISENTIGAWNGATPIEIRLDDSRFSFGSTGAQATINGVNIPLDTTTAVTAFDLIDGGRTLVLRPDMVRMLAAYRTSTRNEIFIDAPILVARDAQVGKDVTATVRGEVSPSSITLAKYTDYAVELKAEKVLDVVAGQDVPGRYVSTVTFEEMVPGSLLDGRVLDVSLVGVDKDGKETSVAAFQYDETIRLTRLSGTGDINIVAEDLQFNGPRNAKNATVTLRELVNGANTGNHKKHDLMEIEINRGSNNASTGSNNPTLVRPIADKWELKVPFVVAANYTGDLFLKFDGAGVDAQKIKIADVKAPVTIQVGAQGERLADLNIGQQNQATPDIVIKETVAGALVEKDVVRLLTNSYGITEQVDNTLPGAADNRTTGLFFTAGKTTVTEGNARLDSDGRSFNLTERSTQPATFLISGITATLDRTVPYGEFKIDIDAGNVFARHRLTDRIERVPYFNVVTPHQTDRNVLTIFTIGESSYKQTISGVETSVTMDVAPQIVNNRTMMPIRFVADALGAKVNYDPATRTAIFSKDATVISMTLDSNIMFVNGSPVVMDVAPQVQNNRALVSLVNVAQAFGLNSVSAPATGDIVYDASARTVTLFPSAQ